MALIARIAELRRRTGLALVSDRGAFRWRRVATPNGMDVVAESYRAAQNRAEARYPTHRIVRQAALQYFERRVDAVYAYGLHLPGILAGADFGLLRRGKFHFVEAMTAHRTDRQEIAKKRRMSRLGTPLIFVVEDRPLKGAKERTCEEFETRAEWRYFQRRVASIARDNETYLCSIKGGIGTIRRYRKGTTRGRR